jgi:hypothetical protein
MSQDYLVRIAKANELQRVKLDEIHKQNEDKLYDIQTKYNEMSSKYENTVSNLNDDVTGLQHTIENYKYSVRKNTTTPPNTSSNKVALLGKLLGECSTKYSEMGQSAEKQLIALEAWQSYGKLIQQVKY